MHLCLRGDPKIPGIVKKIYLKYLYKFETSVPFEALPLRLDAPVPTPLPAASSRRGSASRGTKVSNLYKYIK
jgi:hypothetical protein